MVRQLLSRKPSPAMVVACVALVVALGGTGYAAFRVPAGSVGTKQLRNGAVTKAKIAPATIKALASGGGGAGGQAPAGPPGPKGATGAKGTTGPKGTTGAKGDTGQVGPAGAGYARYSSLAGSGAVGGYVVLSTYPTWTDVISTSVTLQRTSYIQINGQFESGTISTTEQAVTAQVVVDGTPLPGTFAEATMVSNGVLGGHVTLPVTNVLTMTAGTHTIVLQGAYINGTSAAFAYDRAISAIDEG
jgi:hypothetical protein